MAIYRGPGGSGDATTDSSTQAAAAIAAAAEAEASKIAAANSAAQASVSATNAGISAATAATSSNNAQTYANNAATAETNAETAQTAAETAQTAAELAETNAETAETNANASAALAQDWATKTSGPVAGSEYSAKYNANLASTSASNASSSASAASSSASSAASSASTATTKASEASTSASNASTSATNAASSASTASTKASEASTSATNAASSASTASTQASNAASSASTATTQAGIATTKAGEAATSESNAATSASNASTSATNAASSATSANTAKLAAESAQSATEAIYDSFDDRYLGAKATDPTLDNDGNALIIGALFFSTTDNIMKIYTATGWLSAYATLGGALISSNNLSDVNSASTSRSNLGLGSIATQSASSVDITGGTIDGVSLTNIVDLDVANNVQIDGNLTVSGTTVTLNATNLAVEDNMIYLNDGSAVTNPDLGIAGNYNDGTYRHTGVFRDASDGRWKFFHQYTPEPDASAYIDTSHASFALADLQVSTLYGNVTGNVTGNLTGNADTATNGVVTTGSYSNPAWIVSLDDGKVLPSMTGNSGKALLNDGTNSYWGTIDLTTKANTDGSNATGTWSISISGNANTANSGSGTSFFTKSGATEGSIGCRFLGQNDVYLFNNATAYGIYSASGGVAFNYTRSSGTFNFNGNANTVTDGVYTTGSYADPSWITSINYSKLTGTVPTWNQNTTGSSGSTAGCTFSNDAVNKANITTRTDSGFYEHDSGTTAEGWPVNDSGWQHMIACTHTNDANYYSMQIAGSFYDNLFYGRKTNGSGSTAWVNFVTSGNYSSYGITRTTGNPAYYGARAWCNYNGTGTPAFRAQANVSSITKTAAGRYTLTVTTAMPDANYCVSVTGTSYSTGSNESSHSIYGSFGGGASVRSTTQISVSGGDSSVASFIDTADMNIVWHR